jgi:hypothetical protein
MGRLIKYLLSFIVIAFFLAGCATLDQQERLNNLEEQVQEIQKVKKKLSAQELILLAEEAGAAKFWWRNCLIGGGDCLDGINHANVTDGDPAFVMTKSGTTTSMYLYVYDDDDTTAEDSPSVIEPDSGTGAWFLVQIYFAKLMSAADDGEHMINFSNSGAESYTESDGDVTSRRDWDVIYFNDSTYGWIPQKSGADLESSSASLTLDETHCWGGFIKMTGSVNAVVTLPPVQRGMECTIINAYTGGPPDYTLTVDPNGTEIINLQTADESAGECIYTTVDAVGSYVHVRYLTSGKWVVLHEAGSAPWNGCAD